MKKSLPLDDLDLIIYRDNLTVAQKDNKVMILDPVRKQYVKSTPEELVRQLVIQWLMDQYGLGRGFISIEKQITAGLKERRFDLLVLDPQHKPWMLIECKAPGILLTDKVWGQASLYNRSIQAPYVWITNGHSQKLGYWSTDERQFKEIRDFPVR